MEIKAYSPKQFLPSEFVELMNAKYGKAKNFDYFIGDVREAYRFCVENRSIRFEPLAVYADGKMIAHAALISDQRLHAGEAFFGFFETPQDEAVFKLLWDAIKATAKNSKVRFLKGPVDGSVWHPYRLVKETDDSEFFKSEMMCELYYDNFLRSRGPDSEVVYYSAHREKFDAILQAGEAAYERLGEAGFSVREVERTRPEHLKAIMLLSRTVFAANWGFTDLTEGELTQLYSPRKLDSHFNKLYLLYKGKEVVGFASTLKEDNSTLIFKTICVLPEYRGLGLGNALAFKVHRDAWERGIGKIIYALVKEDNNIRNFPKEDAVIFRTYTTFEFSI